MVVRRIQVRDFSSAFRDGPYAMSFVTQTRTHGRILQLDADDGITGLGIDAHRLKQEREREREQPVPLIE